MLGSGTSRRRRRRRGEEDRVILPLPISIHARKKFLLGQFQEWLPDEASPHVEYCGGHLCSAHLLFQFFKGILHTGRVGHVGTDADRLAAGSLDLLDDGFIVGRFARK